MKTITLETTPVRYNDSGIKILHFVKKAGKPGFRLHWHERLEAIRVHSGAIKIESGNESFLLSSGEMALFPPRMPHKGIVLEGSVEYDVLMFDVRSYYNETESVRRRLQAVFSGAAKFEHSTCCHGVISCFDEIISFDGKDSFDEVLLVYRFLSMIYKHMLVSFQEEPSVDTSMRKILQYVQEHFREEISTADLSRKFGYNASYFCRKFKEATWLSPMKYILVLRLEEASRLLSEGQLSVSEVAASCGFSDQNYFSRCFKAHFGYTPRDVLKKEKYRQ